jgi:hypothetical protein
MTKAEYHMERVASVGCCVCRRLGHGYVPASVHHIAEGSGLRNDYAVAALCPEHHVGKSGFHTMGKQFMKLYRVPGETEWGMLAWVNEDLCKYA